jgi:hypothetical protein
MTEMFGPNKNVMACSFHLPVPKSFRACGTNAVIVLFLDGVAAIPPTVKLVWGKL